MFRWSGRCLIDLAKVHRKDFAPASRISFGVARPQIISDRLKHQQRSPSKKAERTYAKEKLYKYVKQTTLEAAGKPHEPCMVRLPDTLLFN